MLSPMIAGKVICVHETKGKIITASSKEQKMALFFFILYKFNLNNFVESHTELSLQTFIYCRMTNRKVIYKG